MEQNLVASIFNSQDQIKQCLATPMPFGLGGQIDCCNLNNEQQQQTNPVDVPSSSSLNGQSTLKATHAGAFDDVLLDDVFVVQVTGVVLKKSQSSLVKQSYIEYQLSVSRLADGVTQQLYKRFRDIKSFYHEIIELNEEIALNQAVMFPNYSENWYSSGSSDPNSDFVQRRKSDLQMFFFELFRQYPILFRSTRVIDFLQLKSFRSKSHSTFSIHYSSHDQGSSAVEILLEVETAIAANSSEASIYDPQTGMLNKLDSAAISPSCVSVVGIMAFAEESKRRKAYYDDAIQHYHLIVEETHRQQFERQMEQKQSGNVIKR